MADFDGVINPPAGWPDVPQLSDQAALLGGAGAPLNAQAVALAARTKHLSNAIAGLDIPGAFDFPTVRPAFMCDFANGGMLDPRITFTSGERTYIEGGVLKIAPANTPVFEDGAWRLRPQETNLALNITSSSWGGGGIKQASTIPAPIADLGTFTKLVPSTSNGQHYVFTALPVTEGKTYTLSGFFLAGEYKFAQLAFNGTYFPLSGRRVFFDLESGEVSWQQSGPVATIEKLAGGVFRFHATAVATATGSAAQMFYINALKTGSTGESDLSFSGDGSSGIYVWGVQVNEGGPIPYIPTTTSQVTVPADSASIRGEAFSEVFNPSEGAVVISLGSNIPSGLLALCQVRLDGIIYRGLRVYLQDNNARFFMSSATNDVHVNAPLAHRDGAKIAAAWRDGVMKVFANGVSSSEGAYDAPGMIFSPILYVGLDANISRKPTLFSSFSIFTRRPSDAELEALTS